MINSQMLINLLVMNTLGMSVLAEALMNASYFYRNFHGNRHTSVDWNEAKECYAFVQGTGLNAILNYYHLDYDAEQLKDGFNYYLKRASF